MQTDCYSLIENVQAANLSSRLTQAKLEKKETLEKSAGKKIESNLVDSRIGKVDDKIESRKESCNDKAVAVEKSSQASKESEKVKVVVEDRNDNVTKEASAQEVNVTAVKVPVSSGKLVMFSPNLRDCGVRVAFGRSRRTSKGSLHI